MTTKMVNGQAINIYSTKELHHFIDQVLCLGRGVTAWEQQFIKDMEGKTQYSEKQAALIERIYSDRT